MAPPRDVDVRKLIEEAIHACRTMRARAGNRISMRVAAEAERAYTDGGKLAVCLAALDVERGEVHLATV